MATEAAPALEPVLEFIGTEACGQLSRVDDGATLFFRTAGSLALEVPATGTYGFCVVPPRPRGVLGTVRLARRFAATVPGPVGDPQKDDDPDEAEPDPNPLVGCFGDPQKDDDPDEAEPDPNPLVGCFGDPQKDDDPDEAEPDPNPFGGEGGLCRPRQWTDDHADLAICASRLGALAPEQPSRWVRGAMQHDNGWDEDVFVFDIEELVWLEIQVRSEIDLVATLTDVAGHQLATSSGDSRDLLDLAKILPRGRYHLRLAALGGEEGEYSLQMDATRVDR